MTETVFYSWQADTPTITGRNLIERALDRAVARIGDDTSLEEAMRELAVDKDTKGAPGSPPIVETILKKIDAAAVFVPDLTFVGKRLDGRPAPNPNVLIEYGWALKSITYNRIVPVMNTAYGIPTADTMPFDLGYLRHPVQYNCLDDTDDDTRRRIRDELSKELEKRIRVVLDSEEYRTTLTSLSAEPELFRAHSSQGTPGRFRGMGIPIGVTTSMVMGGQPIEVRLLPQPAVWLRLMPIVDPNRTWRVTELKALAMQSPLTLLPIAQNWSNLDYFRNDEGFGVYQLNSSDRANTPGVAFAFTNGEVWGVDTYCLDAFQHEGRKYVPSIENELRASLKNYANYLLRLGIKPPFRWEVGMEDLSGRLIALRNGRPLFSSEPCIRPVVVEGGDYTPGESVAQALRPFFVTLYDLCGADRPPELDKD